MPSASSFWATACPIPLAVPVTIAVFLSMGGTYPVSRETTSELPAELADRVAESSVDAWEATVRGFTDYWTGALRRGATPMDVALDGVDWWTAMLDRKKPEWSSPNEVVLESGFAALRDFSDGSRSRVVPTIVLPPQAGHHSCIVDYSRDQSQMATIKAAGLERAYSLEWIGATEETKDTTVEDYVDFIERSISAIGGGPVNLIGDCQGGWLAAIYAALHPEQINTLTLAGAPIDFHAGDAVIGDWVEALGGGDLAFYRWVVDQGGGVLKGEHMLNGFILIKP